MDGTMTANNGPVYLNRKSVAALMDCSVRHVDHMVCRGDLPEPLRIGNLRRWRRKDVVEAIEALAARESKEAHT